MLVTINTDASFAYEKKLGAYAFWIVCNDFRIKKSGVLKGKCISSDEAEMKCILNAIYTLYKANKSISRIIINTDSRNSIMMLTSENKTPKTKLRYGDIFIIYNKLLKKLPYIEYRHVKAHTSVSDKRSFVNRWCDREAKINLKKGLKKLA